MFTKTTKTPRFTLFALVGAFGAAGLVACSGSSNESGGPADGTGGSTTPVTAGSGGASGPSSSSGGATVPGGGVTATGGASSGSGGSATVGSGGVRGGSGGATTATGSGGGTPPVGGGTGGGAPTTLPPPAVGIPAGYPMPTADNAAKCKTVPMAGNFCPGGGAGPVCLQCLFGGTTFGTSETTPTAEGTMLAGDYVVTVRIGGAAAAETFISAESSRGLLQSVKTAAGETRDYAFVVDVRAMEGQPQHAGGPSGYPGLNLFFSGPTATPPLVAGIGYALATPATKPVMVYIAGDSTVCDQTGNNFGGWGQMIPQYFASPVGIANYANSGASSNFGFWNNIKAKWSAGDYVLIQFGHNDKGVADSVVQANLDKMVKDALAAKVTPILISPPARVQFSGNTISSQASLHAASAKAAAAANNIGYVDLTSLSTAWYNELGSAAAALKFHANGSDVTHTNLPGADKLASLIVTDMKAQSLPLAQYLRQ